MSGILGIWNLDGEPVSHDLLARLSRLLAHRGPDGEGHTLQGNLGMSCWGNRTTPESIREVQPLVHRSGVVLVFDGRLDNRAELWARIGSQSALSPADPDPAYVLAAYRTFGTRTPGHLAGDFALGLFDPIQRLLLLARDSIGVRPMYYGRFGPSFAFASEMKALLAHPEASIRPNADALADFLIGRVLTTEATTFFEGVQALQPGHQAVVTPEGITTSRYWDFPCTARTRFRNPADYAEAFRVHLDQAVRRRLRSRHPVAISVSGGLDSSSIFCLAETARLGSRIPVPEIVGISYVSETGAPSDEQSFLFDIEGQYGVAIERIPLRIQGMAGGAWDQIWHMEAPLLDELWETGRHVHLTARERHCRVILSGHWADQVLFSQAYLVDLFRGLQWRRMVRHFHEFVRWFPDEDRATFLTNLWRNLVKHTAPSELVALLRKRRTSHGRPWYTPAFRNRARRPGRRHWLPLSARATAHARSLYEEIRSARHVLCMEWDNKAAAMAGLDAAYPFLDRDLLTFLMTIPGDMQSCRGIPKGILREGLRGILPEPIRHRAWKADFTDTVNRNVARDYRHSCQLLRQHDRAVQAGYIDQAERDHALGRVPKQLDGESCEASWQLSELLGLELWLRSFGNRTQFDQQAATRQAPSTMPVGG